MRQAWLSAWSSGLAWRPRSFARRTQTCLLGELFIFANEASRGYPTVAPHFLLGRQAVFPTVWFPLLDGCES